MEIVVAGDLTDKHNELLERLVEVPRAAAGRSGSIRAGERLCRHFSRGTHPSAGLANPGVVLGNVPQRPCSPSPRVPNGSSRPSHTFSFIGPLVERRERADREAAEWTRHFGVLEDEMDRLLARLLDFPLETILPGRARAGSSGTELVAAGLAKMVDLFSGDLRSQIGRVVK